MTTNQLNGHAKQGHFLFDQCCFFVSMMRFGNCSARACRRNLVFLNIKHYADTFRPRMTFVFDFLIRVYP